MSRQWSSDLGGNIVVCRHTDTIFLGWHFFGRTDLGGL